MESVDSSDSSESIKTDLLAEKNVENPYCTEATINSLSAGLLSNFEPPLRKTKEQLNELLNKQTILIEQIHDQNLQLSKSLNSSELKGMLDLVTVYQEKVSNIKKAMYFLHERSVKLQKRTTKLQHYREKEIYLKQQQQHHEQSLIAKSSSS